MQHTLIVAEPQNTGPATRTWVSQATSIGDNLDFAHGFCSSFRTDTFELAHAPVARTANIDIKTPKNLTTLAPPHSYTSL